MGLTNIKKMRDEQGFTIVELLIVIIVIGILAAIIIVAYNGVTSKANNSAAQAAAGTMAKKIEAFNAQGGAYPSVPGGSGPTPTVTSQLSGDTTTTLTGSGLTIGTPTAANGKNTVQVQLCGATTPAAGTVATGYQIYFWDYTKGAISTAPSNTGGSNAAVGSTTCTAVTS